MLSGSFFPLISRPTRITSNSTALIDNIFTNDPSTDCSASSLPFTDISKGYLCNPSSDRENQYTKIIDEN